MKLYKCDKCRILIDITIVHL